jgi:hypothetical protein
MRDVWGLCKVVRFHPELLLLAHAGAGCLYICGRRLAGILLAAVVVVAFLVYR